METKTAFDLNIAIQRWRDHLSQSPQFRPENLEELEIHLRDSIAAFRSTALSEEEAFLVATRRLGGAPVLAPEFAKVNSKEVWMNRLLWMLVGAQLWPLLQSFASTVADAAVMGGLVGFGYHFTLTQGYFGLSTVPVVLLVTANALALASCLGACWWAFRNKGRSFAEAAVSLLGRPLAVSILACVVPPLVLRCFGVVDTVLLVKWLRPETHGVVFNSRNWASALSSLILAIALVVVTVLLARRQLRLRTNS
jgi:hypothetical protein